MLPPLPARIGPALHLVRHGQSTWNAQQLVQGQADEPELTELGRAQAAELGRLIAGTPVVRLLTSDLRRAVQTAEVLGSALDLQPIPTALLRERALGCLEGLSSDRAVLEWDQLASTDSDGRPLAAIDVAPVGGESLRAVLARVAAFLALPWITDETGEVVVVSHGDTIRMLLAHLLGDDVDQLTWREVGNGEVHSLYRTPAGRMEHGQIRLPISRAGPG